MSLSDSEKTLIVESIRIAEKQTSGEIRVHVEKFCPGNNPLDRATEIFHQLNMQQTAARNGVLVYVALNDRKFSVIGDEGIHAKVGSDFWSEMANELKAHLVKNEIAAGICAAVALAGQKLKVHFPYSGNDKNELSDEISEA
ncbi:MAG: TPM domain-containing protein [Chitinophagales bacterium]